NLVERVLSAIPAVQAFTREELEHARFRGYAKDTVAAYLRSNSIKAWYGLLAGLVTTLGTAGIMWLGTQYPLDGRITTGEILVFLAYLGSLYGPLSTLTELASTWQYMAANRDRVMEVLDTSPDVCDQPNALEVPLRGNVCYE